MKFNDCMMKRIYLFLSVFFVCLGLSAQITMQNLHQVKVDNLSDAQVSDFVKKYTDAGYTLSDVEQMAKAKNMPSSEFEKLKQRINNSDMRVNQVSTSDVSEGVSDMTSTAVQNQRIEDGCSDVAGSIYVEGHSHPLVQPGDCCLHEQCGIVWCL